MIRYGRQEIEDTTISDPGDAGTILVDRNHAICSMTSVGEETRTLARPLAAGIYFTVYHCMDDDEFGAPITLTVTGGYDEAEHTDIVFYCYGQWATFISVAYEDGFVWRKTGDYWLANASSDLLALLTSLRALSASAAEMNQAADESENTEIVTDINVIVGTESGATYYLANADGFTSTLPAPAKGMRFEFIVSVAPTTDYVITTDSGANILYGMMLERAGGAGVAGAAQDTFKFVASQAKIGDCVQFRSDGTNWHYRGMVDVAAGNTVSVT